MIHRHLICCTNKIQRQVTNKEELDTGEAKKGKEGKEGQEEAKEGEGEGKRS